MQKWLVLLAAALLLNSVQAQTEERIFYTNNEDRYYHADAGCDRPAKTNWWDGEAQIYFEREAYRKYEISETAALEFAKEACPVCSGAFAPVYLGEHMPEWKYMDLPWELGMEDAQAQAFADARPKAYLDEIILTSEAFDAYYEEIYNRETGMHERRHAYPAFYAGKYLNNAGCVSYRVVAPDAKILSAFRDMFGGGAWIVPAKYGYDEIHAACEKVCEALRNWCAAHPETDARWVSSRGPDYYNYAVIGIDGEDWEKAASAMEEIAPLYIHFTPDEPSELL